MTLSAGEQLREWTTSRRRFTIPVIKDGGDSEGNCELGICGPYGAIFVCKSEYPLFSRT